MYVQTYRREKMHCSLKKVQRSNWEFDRSGIQIHASEAQSLRPLAHPARALSCLLDLKLRNALHYKDGLVICACT